MMATKRISMTEARKRLPELVDWVAEGNEAILTRRGKAVARITPHVHQQVMLGCARGTVRFKSGWDKPIPLDQMIGKLP